MTRQEAESLIGTHVMAWTAANGVYVGTLAAVKVTRPWRGVVAITGVLTPAQAFEFGRDRPRRGFRPGEEIEVGGANIKPALTLGTSYADVLRSDLAHHEQLLEHASGVSRVVIEKSIAIRRSQIETEAVSLTEIKSH